MENVTRALLMAFSMIIFVIGFSFSMYLINKLTTTANVLLDSVESTNYYDNIEVKGSDVIKRDVGVETIIPVLYRYYKEQYSVKIVDKNGNVIQLFDLGVEGKIASAASNTKNDPEAKSLNTMYNSKSQKVYLFEAPWIGNVSQDARTRIDYFLNGTKGYINNTLVDYSKDGPAFDNNGGFLKYAKDKTFEESFIEYVYEGETISTEDGLETITGNTQENSKIVITYTEK